MIDRTATPAQIVLEHAECAAVFLRHRIGFCDRGGASLDQACAARGVDAAALVRELEATCEACGRAPPDTVTNVRALDTAALVARLVARHHAT
jgi:regulator of cell morphogenesis and NO signaling